MTKISEAKLQIIDEIFGNVLAVLDPIVTELASKVANLELEATGRGQGPLRPTAPATAPYKQPTVEVPTAQQP